MDYVGLVGDEYDFIQAIIDYDALKTALKSLSDREKKIIVAHILDEDRKINAQKFESAFYSNPDLRKVAPPPEESQSQTVDLAALIEQLQKSPELANTLASIIAGQKAC